MTASITPNVDVRRLARRIHGTQSPARLRSSERRRQRLENWARTMAEQDLTLELDPKEGRTAAVHLSGGIPQVRIPSWELPQPLTDYDRRAYDYLMQRTLSIHEVGHIRYTDQQAVDDVVSKVSQKNRDFFHNIWNALEDGAIEEQLRHEFAVADELAVMNANFGAAGAQGVSEYGMADAIITGCLDLSVYDSGRLASLVDPADTSCRFNNKTDRQQFVSDVLPELKTAAVDVVTESDPRARAERVLELWEELTDILDIEEIDPPQIDDGGKGDHVYQDNGSGEQAPDLDGIDEDSATSFVDDVSDKNVDGDGGNQDSGNGAGSDPGPGGDTNVDTDDVVQHDDGDSGDTDSESSNTGSGGNDQDGATDTETRDESVSNGTEDAGVDRFTDEDDRSGQNDANDATQESSSSTPAPDTSRSADDEGSRLDDQDSDRVDGRDTAQETTGSGSGAGSGGTISRDLDDPAETSDRLEGQYGDLVEEQQREANEVSEQIASEYDAFRRALERIADAEETPTELDLVDPTDYRTSAWPQTKRTGKKLKRILGQRLNEEDRGNIRRGLRSGRIDPRLLTRIKRKDPRIFRQREKPDEKAYAAVLIIDRSRSMRRSIHATEEATTAFAYALSSLGIETCIIDVGGRSPRLSKPFGVDPSDSLETLLTGEYGGSTPLSPALRIARERLREKEEFPFVIVATDGEPNNKQRYKAELSECQFPVLGVYLNFGGSSNPEKIDQSADLFDRRRIVTKRDHLESELRELCQSVMF